MKTQSILYLLLLINFVCFSQRNDNPKIDSLLHEIKTLPEDTSKVNTLIVLGTLYLDSDIKEALKYGNQARDLSEKVNFRKGLGFARKLLGIGNAYNDNYYEADIQFKEALKSFESIDFKDGIANILNNLGSLNFVLGNDTKSIEYHLKSLNVSMETKNKFRIATNLSNIGTVYSNKTATTDKAINYFLRALPILEEINYTDGIGTVTLNIGEIYFNKGMYDSALTFFKTSIKMYQGTADAAVALSYVGEIYAERNDFENAFIYHNQAVEVTEKLGAQQYLAQSLLSLAKTQRKKGDLLKAIEIYKKAQKISEEIKARQEIKKSYESLAECYAEVGDFKNAYAYKTLLISIKDTLYNNNERKVIQQLQFNFDIHDKETLAREQALQELQKQREQINTIQKNKIINYAAAFSFVLILIISGVTLRFFQIRKTKRIIEEEKARSENLLLNILPKEVAEELKIKGESKARNFDQVTVLFTDFKDFTSIAETLSPQELVAEINTCFKAFDQIITKYGIEKIKTIGDSYMAAGGLGSKSLTSAKDVVTAGMEMQEFMLS